MASEKKRATKCIDVPMDRPGFSALGMAAPVIVQINPDGKWEKAPPEKLDELKLKEIVKFLNDTKAIPAAETYCNQCCSENKRRGAVKTKKTYVPVIMLPITPDKLCPFDMEALINKMKEEEQKKKKTKIGDDAKEPDQETTKDPDKERIAAYKKRGYVLQRFSNFDYVSQW